MKGVELSALAVAAQGHQAPKNPEGGDGDVAVRELQSALERAAAGLTQLRAEAAAARERLSAAEQAAGEGAGAQGLVGRGGAGRVRGNAEVGPAGTGTSGRRGRQQQQQPLEQQALVRQRQGLERDLKEVRTPRRCRVAAGHPRLCKWLSHNPHL